MYIIAIAWLYVITILAAAMDNGWLGLMIFIFFGLLPLVFSLWILQKKRHAQGQKPNP
ncbi:MAG: hypothetical protein K2P98_01065 [Neisseriaceae bacterium]|nr:hypothetical protein [Neisseriaceae bacterium]